MTETISEDKMTALRCREAIQACDYAFRVFSNADSTVYERINALAMLQRLSGKKS